jgi:hypothetical protein
MIHGDCVPCFKPEGKKEVTHIWPCFPWIIIYDYKQSCVSKCFAREMAKTFSKKVEVLNHRCTSKKTSCFVFNLSSKTYLYYTAKFISIYNSVKWDDHARYCRIPKKWKYLETNYLKRCETNKQPTWKVNNGNWHMNFRLSFWYGITCLHYYPCCLSLVKF